MDNKKAELLIKTDRQVTDKDTCTTPIMAADWLTVLSGLFVTLFLGALFFSLPVFAHGPGATPISKTVKDNRAREPLNPQRPIRMRMDVAEQKIRLFITDQFDQPVDVELASATAFLEINGITTMLRLLPETSNVLSTEDYFTPDPTMRVHVTLRLSGHRPINESFTPLQP